MKERKSYYKLIEEIAIIILIFLFTFPSIEPDYAIGLDSSYVWALNYLFHIDFDILKELIYPIGIFGFLKMPTTEGYNLIYSLLIYSTLKIWFIASFLNLVKNVNPQRKNLSFIVVTIISALSSIDFIIIGLCAIQSIIYVDKTKILNLLLSIFFAFLGFYIKSSIGISAFSIIFMSFLLALYFKRNYVKTIKFVGISIVASIFLGLLIFHDFGLFFRYCINTFKLLSGYSDALSLHPDNNWWVLSGFLLTIFIIPFIFKDRNSRIVFLLFLPTLFAMWKHAMSREDVSHNSILLSFLFLFWGILFVYSKARVKLLFLISAFSILLFYSNLSNLPMFKGRKIEICGIHNFQESVIEYNEFKKKYIAISDNNIHDNKLSDSIMSVIANANIDIYPWELSFIPANNLNWKPRKTLQSGSYSQWLDSLSARDFDRENGADYILFHFMKDKWGGDFGSIDGRYLLNDNPKTIFNILNNYSLEIKTDKYLLFKQNIKNNFSGIISKNKQITKWNTWIDVPVSNGELLRLKVFSETSLIGKLKNFLYKSEAYYVDYMLDDNKILSYRYVPENAKDGIWINPFLQFPVSNKIGQRVVKIRFRCSYSAFNKDLFKYQFERIQLDITQYPKNDMIDISNYLFLKTKQNRDSVFVQVVNEFEKSIYNNQHNTLLNKGISFSGDYSNEIDSKGFSQSFTYSLDSLWSNVDSTINNLALETDLRYLNINSDAKLIISVSNSNDDFWHATELKNNKNIDFWEYSYLNKSLFRKKHCTGIMKVYVWNSGEEKVFIDNFRLTIKIIVDLSEGVKIISFVSKFA